MAEFSRTGSSSGGINLAGRKSSGLSLRLYSERHGLKTGKLGSWNSRLKAQGADAGASAPCGLQYPVQRPYGGPSPLSI
jgi:hypothetical protein